MQVVRTFANKAATDLSAKDGYCGIYDSGLNVASAITDPVVGIITKGGDDTLLQSEVCVLGECTAKLGGTVAAGQVIQPHTDGTVVVSAASSSRDFGLCLEGGVAGDFVKVLVLGSTSKHS